MGKERNQRNQNPKEEMGIHYSDKGGHFLRGKYWKLINSLPAPQPHMRFIPAENPAPVIEEMRRIRRAMRRTPYDGRR